jgi:lipopolysaccharide transport system ATP-binding protein
MTAPAISVEKISKRYILGHQRVKSEDGLRHALERTARRPLKWLWSTVRGSQTRNEDFWALKDVSFEVKQGQVVGIIGQNGAGKSTLLKILSRITEPTQGRIRLRGRVASLLEVGTGFHQELTGRENIFLNGAILGMSKGEIRRKFDEIVAFSEVEQFLDTPVKRYSSGMYVRLAFAVAAHLEPEILVVDEVLAVGDAAFQSKCLGRMANIAQGGRTVLFVSHNMAAVQRLCSHCALLHKGKLVDFGATSRIISRYLSESNCRSENSLENFPKRSGSGVIRFTSLHLEDAEGCRVECVQSGMDFSIVLGYRCTTPMLARKVDVGFSLHLPDTTMLAVLYSSYTGEVFANVPSTGEFRCLIRSLPLKEGRYLIGVRVVANGDEADWPQGFVGAVEVVSGDFFGTGIRGFQGAAPLLLAGAWQIKSEGHGIRRIN